jgi:hypothetical protein
MACSNHYVDLGDCRDCRLAGDREERDNRRASETEARDKRFRRDADERTRIAAASRVEAAQIRESGIQARFEARQREQRQREQARLEEVSLRDQLARERAHEDFLKTPEGRRWSEEQEGAAAYRAQFAEPEQGIPSGLLWAGAYAASFLVAYVLATVLQHTTGVPGVVTLVLCGASVYLSVRHARARRARKRADAACAAEAAPLAPEPALVLSESEATASVRWHKLERRTQARLLQLRDAGLSGHPVLARDAGDLADAATRGTEVNLARLERFSDQGRAYLRVTLDPGLLDMLDSVDAYQVQHDAWAADEAARVRAPGPSGSDPAASLDGAETAAPQSHGRATSVPPRDPSAPRRPMSFMAAAKWVPLEDADTRRILELALERGTFTGESARLEALRPELEALLEAGLLEQVQAPEAHWGFIPGPQASEALAWAQDRATRFTSPTTNPITDPTGATS